MYLILVLTLLSLVSLPLDNCPAEHINWQGNDWYGDVNSFVQAGESVKLSASDAGSAFLYTEMYPGEQVHWDISFQLDFESSASNFIRFYLDLDTPNISTASGHFIQIGASGSPDPVEFYTLEKGEEHLLDIFPVVASSRLTIQTDSLGSWKLYEYDSLGFPRSHMAVQDAAPLGTFKGLLCQFTSSRREGFTIQRMLSRPHLPDHRVPELDTVFASGRQMITLRFNEGVTHSLAFMAQFGTYECALDTASRRWNEVSLRIQSPPNNPTTSPLTILGIQDTSGNLFSLQGYPVHFNFPEQPEPGDLVINEVLFDPLTGDPTFIEIYFNTDHAISFDSVRLEIERAGNRSAVESWPNAITTVPSFSTVAFSERPEDIIHRYPRHDPDWILQMEVPSLDRSTGSIKLIRQDSMIIDSAAYSEHDHSPLLTETRGVSLERIDPDHARLGITAWASASSTSGFATPGLSNSQLVTMDHDQSVDPPYSLSSNIVTPNQDGNNDIILVTLDSTLAGSIIRAQVFSLNGHLVHESLPQTLGANSTLVVWDGTDTDSRIPPAGIYIAVFRIYNPKSWKKKHFREGVLLATSQ